MRQIIQSYKTGELNLVEVPVPSLKSGGILVRNVNSLVSAGTEKLMISLAKKSIIGKAKARPDLVKQMINKVKSDGLMEVYRQAMSRLDSPVLLGYSSAGYVEQVGKNVDEFNKGDRVACTGSGYASHAEMVYVPKNLVVKIPDGVSYEESAFVALGAIALHAVRCADVSLGENVAVIGLGLLGLITVQLLNASGCKVFGIDHSENRMNLAQQLGAKKCVASNENTQREINIFTNGNGVDSVIIFASTESNQPIELAADIARERANIVVPGMVGLNIPREVFYHKELKLVVSRSSGPGKYDPNYEERGNDYPISYVRWTEQRNMNQFLELVADGKVKLDELVTHRFNIENALSAYEMIMENTEPYIGVLLSYDNTPKHNLNTKVIIEKKRKEHKVKSEIGVGLIGAGQYANGTLIPSLKKVDLPISLIGVATASGSSGNHVAKKFGFDYCTTDYKQLLADENIDVILIATRHNLHAPMTIEALKAGKHVYCEKPLVLREDELNDLTNVYEGLADKPVLMVGFNRRFSKHITRIKEFVDSTNERPVINYRINAGFIPKDTWVQDPEIGGGRIIGEVCHFIDVSSFIADSPVKEVFASELVTPGDYNRDNISITLKFANGAQAIINYLSNGSKLVPKEYIEIFCGGGVAICDNFKKTEIIQKYKKIKIRNWFSYDKGFQAELESFKEAIISKGANPIPFSSILNTTRTTFKILESININGVISV
jgi:predicted dehydrogenase/threonine dehydrogenase-like Zn-dependent dehydrogenase